MQAASLHSLPLPTRPFSGNLRRFNRRKQRPSTAVSASNRDAYDRDHYNGRIVDENMIVLTMRIREMKMAERNCESSPSEWTEWEKRNCKRYDKDICEAVGYLQSALMETRPSLALRMVAFFSFSVLTSTSLAVFYLMEFFKGILDRVHLS